MNLNNMIRQVIKIKTRKMQTTINYNNLNSIIINKVLTKLFKIRLNKTLKNN